MQRKLGIGVLAVGLSWSAHAAADRYDFEASTPQRDGFVVGASFGRGSIDVKCDSCGNRPSLKEALSVAAHVGYMITPRLAVLGEHWSVRYNARGGHWFDDSVAHLVAQHITAVAAQVFVTDSVWLKAGIGVGRHISDGDYARQHSGPQTPMVVSKDSMGPAPSESPSGASPASFVAVGWEFAHNSMFAAEIQLRTGTTRRPDNLYQVYNAALNVGFNWY
jgi:hypothetical protein